MPHLTIIVGKDGTVRVDAEGFKGSACEAATAPFLAAAGRTTWTEPKAEYYESEADLAKEGN